MFKKFTFLISLIVVLVLSYFAVRPFFNNGFFPMHDDTQVARVFEMSKSLKDGMFPVRWVSDLGYGYGYPIFNFYAPLSYYFGAGFVLFGLNALLATKIMMVVGFVLAGIAMYLLVDSFAGKISGVVSALFYLYAPYHALDMYVRGDVGEFWAYAFIPLVFLFLFKTYQTQKWRYVVLGSLSLFGVIVSHNLTALMLVPFLGIFLMGLLINSYRLKNLNFVLPFLSSLLGLLLSSFYFIPALLEIKYTNVLSQLDGAADPLKHFVCIGQFWYSPWGYGGSSVGCVDGLSFALGKITIALLVISLICLPFCYFKKRNLFTVSLASVLLTIFSLFLTTNYSIFIWKSLPFMSFFQYPWRFLLMAAFFSSINFGLLFALVKNKIVCLIIASILVIILIAVNMKIFVPQDIFQTTSEFYTNKSALNFATSKISDEYLPKGFTKIKNSSDIPHSIFYVLKPAQIHVLTDTTQEKVISISTTLDQRGFWNIAYFPGWTYYVDGQEVTTQIFPRNMAITVPQGTHIIEAKYTSTTIEKIANSISIAGVICLLLGIITVSRKGNKNP